MNSSIIRDNICKLIHKKWRPKSYYSGIRCHMAPNIIFSVVLLMIDNCVTWITTRSYWHSLCVCYIGHPNYRSPPLIWHVWSRKKVSYYLNVAFLIIWYFGLKCRIIEVFRENGLFCIHNEDTHVWKNILYWRNMLTTSHNMEFFLQKIIVPWWYLYHITHYKSKNLLSFDDVCWCWNLTSCSIIHKRLYAHHICNSKECSTAKFDSNWALS